MRVHLSLRAVSSLPVREQRISNQTKHAMRALTSVNANSIGLACDFVHCPTCNVCIHKVRLLLRLVSFGVFDMNGGARADSVGTLAFPTLTKLVHKHANKEQPLNKQVIPNVFFCSLFINADCPVCHQSMASSKCDRAVAIPKCGHPLHKV
jgi:hypothetical protein